MGQRGTPAPGNRQAAFPVTREQVTAFRLRRHHLLERAPAAGLLPVVRDMAGAQSQLDSAARISLWSRIRDLQPGHIEEALDGKRLVKAACMRRTLFLVPAGDLAVFVRGATRRAEKEVRWTLRKGVPDRLVQAAIDAALGALDRPLTRPEVAERVCRTLGVRPRAIHGGGWGSRRKVAAVPVGELVFPVVDLLHLAAARGVVCYGPGRGNEPTFVRADAWVPGWQDVPAQEAEDLLLRIYLRSFGPATASDFALWTGMTLREARQVWARRQAGLVTVDVQGWPADLLEEDLDGLAEARLERPTVRLLPYFDSYLLGHKEREHLVAVQQRARVYRPQGWIAPVVLVDGRAAAVWGSTREGDRLVVTVEPMSRLSRRIAPAIRREARDLARFLGVPRVEVRVEGAGA